MSSTTILKHFYISGREEWMSAIEEVSNQLSQTASEDVDMESQESGDREKRDSEEDDEDIDGDLESKFSLMGTSSCKSSGKRKVVSFICFTTGDVLQQI